MENSIFVTDLKLAAILCALGVRRRKSDPITCIIRTLDGRDDPQYSFWFDVSGVNEADKAREYIRAYAAARNWDNSVLGEEHPLYWMKAALENREALMHQMRSNVAPLREFVHGSKTVLIGERASARTREIIRQHL
jgi:hypothetical protein